MSFALTLLMIFAATPFQLKIDQAFSNIQSKDWRMAASALDEAYAEQPASFAANNLHYLRGRIAENQGDWRRALAEFKKAESNNPLYSAALWHSAWSSAKLHDDAATMSFISMLPRNFPRELKLQLAQETIGDVALKIYEDVGNREGRYQRARVLGDSGTLWSLIREDKDDDVALRSARFVAAAASTTPDQILLGEVFANHRQFDDALALYQKVVMASDAANVADVRFRIARIHFQKENFSLAIEHFLAIAKDFPGTNWEEDSEYQIANCYWRLADYRGSERAYLDYIKKYGDAGMREAATRNLVDVYRALGENQKALTTLDRALATKLSASTRQVFLFTKAKILYTEKRYAASLALFQQLSRTKLRSAPGSATAEEVQYLQALVLSKMGNKTAARTIWQKLAADSLSYYGQRAAEKLGKDNIGSSAGVCSANQDSITQSLEADLSSLRRPLREEMDPAADVVSELIFLRLWDEAAFWMNWSSDSKLPRLKAAQVAYLGGEFDRAISLANRLPKNGSALPLFYPAGYRRFICQSATTHKADPLWLHAIIWQESKYDPNTMSGAGARGLMQFIPETANAVAASIGMPPLAVEKLYDPATSIELGATYWFSLMDKFKSPEMALAAYNGGPDNVERWRSKSSSDPELFVSDIGFVETKKYVMLVFAAHAAYRSLSE